MTHQRRVLSPEKWLVAIKSVLSQFEEFQNTTIVLDQRNSFDDVLEFDINDYYGDMNYRVSEKLYERFGNLVSIQHSPDSQDSRRKIVTLKVTRPPPNVLTARTIPTWLLWLLVIFAVFQFMAAIYFLNEHTRSRNDPFSVLIHTVFMLFAPIVHKITG
jgi:hypothetical protein